MFTPVTTPITNLTYFRLMKAATTAAYLAALWLTWRFIDHELPINLAIGCVALSGCWLVLTRLQIGHLLKTYFDVLSRLEVVLPMTLGIILSVSAIFVIQVPFVHLIAVAELIVWLSLYFQYHINRHHYFQQGHGPLPIGTWVSPPDEALIGGDLILTSGRVANNLHESVGHAELVIKMPDGSIKTLSSYMNKGTVLTPLNNVTSDILQHGHYVVLRLAQPLSKEQLAIMPEVAKSMVRATRRWRMKVNIARAKLIGRLPLPVKAQQALMNTVRATGYDWLGLFMGRITADHWTCIGSCLELYRRIGVHTNPYGTGLLGFGTTLLDPIMPVRLLADPAFKILTQSDKEAFTNKSGAAA